MKRHASIPILGLALLAALNCAQARESAFHNDMNGDGKSDLIWYKASTGAMVYWSAAGAASSVKIQVTSGTPGYIYDPRAWAPTFAMSDLWFDPSRTMLMARSVSGHTQSGLFPGGEYFWFSPNAIAFTGAVAHGDFNGNGIADLFYRDPQSGENFIEFDTLLHDWGASYKHEPTVGLAWSVVGTGDFDGDESSDILWRNASTGRNAIWRSGSYATRLGIASVVNLDWKVAAVGDFNGDERSDILWRNTRTGANVIWKSGNHLTPQAVAGVTDRNWQVVATGDFDGDGKWDLVWRNSATGANRLWKSANAAIRVTLPTVNIGWSVLM